MVRKLSIIAALISSLTLTTAFAEDGLNARTGFYLGGALSSSYANPPPGVSLDGALSTAGTWFYGLGDVGIMPIMGYRFNDYFALEANYNDLANSNNNADGIYGPDHYRLWTAGLAGKLIMPFNDSDFSFYGKGGFAVTHQDAYNKFLVIDDQPIIDSDTTRIQPLVGAGLTYNFRQSTAMDLGVTHQMESGITPEIDVLTLGLTYTF